MTRKPAGSSGGAQSDGAGEASDMRSTEPRISSNPVTEEIRRMMAGQSFASLDEAQAVIDRITHRHNRTPNADFEGLTPEQMMWMLHHPFDAAHIAEFAPFPITAPDAPVARLFDFLVKAVGDAGVKLTATGNLPLSVVRPVALAYWGEDLHAQMTRYGILQSETKFRDLNTLRETARMAGLVRKSTGKFFITRTCRASMDKHGIAAPYAVLLRVFAGRYNWGYRDYYPELSIVQDSFLFSLYLIHRYGETWREKSFYEDALIRAFPMALDQIPPEPYSTPERTLRRCYSLRFLQRFAEFFGLIETEKTSDDYLDNRFRLRKGPLLEEAVTFHI